MWSRWSDLDRMFSVMDQLHEQMNRIVSGYGRMPGPPLFPGVGETGPGTNLYDAGDHLEMRVEVPGMARDDLNIRIQGNYLEIRGARKADAPEGYSAHRVERGAASFTRSFTLPSDVDAAKVEASLADGVLTIRMPKSEAARPRQITIG